MTVRCSPGMSTMIWYIYQEYLKKMRDIRKKPGQEPKKRPEYNRKQNDDWADKTGE